MPPQIKITPKDNYVKVKITGPFTLQDIFDITEKISDGEKFLYNRRVFDLREAEGDFVAEEMKILAEKCRNLDQEYSRIALLGSDDLSFGLMRMYQVLREQKNTDISVFRNKNKALEWVQSG